jgi:hypothetical protein
MQDNTLTLYRKQDQVFLKRKGKEDTPVSVVWLRPATEGAEEISLYHWAGRGLPSQQS